MTRPDDHSDSPSNDITPTRRKLLKATGAGTFAVGLAGCLGGNQGDDSTIKVGLALPTSGTLSVLGENLADGFNLRLQELEEEINGQEVEVIQEDTASDPSTGASIAEEFLQSENVDFIVGPASSAVGGAMKSTIDENGGAIWINPNAGNDDLIKDGCSQYHFRVGWSNWHNSVPMAQWALDNVADNVFLTYANYSAGTQYTQNFAQAFEELGGTVVGEASNPLGTSDFSPLLQQVQSSDADAIWSFHPGADAVNYIKGVADFGINEEKEQMCPGFMLTQTTLPAQGEAALGMRSILHYTYNKETEQNQEFRQNFSSEYDSRSNVYACSGYDAAQTIEKAVNETGGTEVDSVIEALRGAEIESPRGTFTIDAERQDPHMSLDIRQVTSSDSGPPVNEVIDTLGEKRVPWTCNF